MSIEIELFCSVTRLGCLPGLETIAMSGFVLDIRMNRNNWRKATSRWSHVRYKAMFSECVKSGTSKFQSHNDEREKNRKRKRKRQAGSPMPVRYSSASRSLTSSSFRSFVLFGRPLRRAARSSSSSASCRVSQTSETSSWSSGNVKTLPRS